MNDQERARYIDEVFGLDPASQAVAVCALRATALGLAGTAESTAEHAQPDVDDAAERRERDESRLRALQKRLFELSDEDLAKAVKLVGRTEEPDLQQWAKRLGKAAAVRDELNAMRTDRHMDKRVGNDLVEVAISAPEDAARIGLRRRDRIPVKVAARAAKLVRKRYPGVAALVPGELAKFKELKRERKLSKPAAAVGSFITVWIIIQIIRVVARLAGGD